MFDGVSTPEAALQTPPQVESSQEGSTPSSAFDAITSNMDAGDVATAAHLGGVETITPVSEHGGPTDANAEAEMATFQKQMQMLQEARANINAAKQEAPGDNIVTHPQIDTLSQTSHIEPKKVWSWNTEEIKAFITNALANVKKIASLPGRAIKGVLGVAFRWFTDTPKPPSSSPSTA